MEKQIIVGTLSEIADRAQSMLSFPQEERVLDYRALDPLLLSLEAELAHFPNPVASEKLSELKLHLIMVAHLDDPDGYTDEEHCSRAAKIVEELQAELG